MEINQIVEIIEKNMAEIDAGERPDKVENVTVLHVGKGFVDLSTGFRTGNSLFLDAVEGDMYEITTTYKKATGFGKVSSAKKIRCVK